MSGLKELSYPMGFENTFVIDVIPISNFELVNWDTPQLQNDEEDPVLKQKIKIKGKSKKIPKDSEFTFHWLRQYQGQNKAKEIEVIPTLLEFPEGGAEGEWTFEVELDLIQHKLVGTGKLGFRLQNNFPHSPEIEVKPEAGYAFHFPFAVTFQNPSEEVPLIGTEVEVHLQADPLFKICGFQLEIRESDQGESESSSTNPDDVYVQSHNWIFQEEHPPEPSSGSNSEPSSDSNSEPSSDSSSESSSDSSSESSSDQVSNQEQAGYTPFVWSIGCIVSRDGDQRILQELTYPEKREHEKLEYEYTLILSHTSGEEEPQTATLSKKIPIQIQGQPKPIQVPYPKLTQFEIIATSLAQVEGLPIEIPRGQFLDFFLSKEEGVVMELEQTEDETTASETTASETTGNEIEPTEETIPEPEEEIQEFPYEFFPIIELEGISSHLSLSFQIDYYRYLPHETGYLNDLLSAGNQITWSGRDGIGSEMTTHQVQVMSNTECNLNHFLGVLNIKPNLLPRDRLVPFYQVFDYDEKKLVAFKKILSEAEGQPQKTEGDSTMKHLALSIATYANEGTNQEHLMKTKIPIGISPEGVKKIAKFEGFKGVLYNDQAGHCTIGYGHLVHEGNCNGTESSQFRRGITEKKAEELLKKDIKKREQLIKKLVKVPLTQNQLDALLMLLFNIGEGNFRSSTLRRKLNKGDYQGASEQFLVWNKVTKRGAKVVSKGLERRRKAEKKLFDQ